MTERQTTPDGGASKLEKLWRERERTAAEHELRLIAERAAGNQTRQDRNIETVAILRTAEAMAEESFERLWQIDEAIMAEPIIDLHDLAIKAEVTKLRNGEEDGIFRIEFVHQLANEVQQIAALMK